MIVRYLNVLTFRRLEGGRSVLSDSNVRERILLKVHTYAADVNINKYRIYILQKRMYLRGRRLKD